jgi:hypothetical protein
MVELSKVKRCSDYGDVSIGTRFKLLDEEAHAMLREALARNISNVLITPSRTPGVLMQIRSHAICYIVWLSRLTQQGLPFVADFVLRGIVIITAAVDGKWDLP